MTSILPIQLSTVHIIVDEVPRQKLQLIDKKTLQIFMSDPWLLV